MIRLRRATADDADALALVHVQAWREAYVGLVPDNVLAELDPARRAAMWREGMARTAMLQLAEQDDAIIGFGSSRRQTDPSSPYSGEIGALYVLRHAQRQGTGRRLMAAMARDLLDAGHVAASLWVLEGNATARRFYAALGGQEIARCEQQHEGFAAVGIAYGWPDLTRLI